MLERYRDRAQKAVGVPNLGEFVTRLQPVLAARFALVVGHGGIVWTEAERVPRLNSNISLEQLRRRWLAEAETRIQP